MLFSTAGTLTVAVGTGMWGGYPSARPDFARSDRFVAWPLV